MINYLGPFKYGKEYWWQERYFEYQGYHGKEFLWPSDRVVCFNEKEPAGCLIPVFDLRAIKKTVEKLIDDEVANYIRFNKRIKKVYIHLIKISDYPNLIGVFFSGREYTPKVDFFRHCTKEYRDREKRKLKLKKKNKKP